MNPTSYDTSATLAATFVQASACDQQTLLDMLADEVGHRSIFQQPAIWCSGSSLYVIDDRWQRDAALKSGDHTICRSRDDFRAFLADREAESALLTAETGMALDEAVRLLEACAHIKTVLFDVAASA